MQIAKVVMSVIAAAVIALIGSDHGSLAAQPDHDMPTSPEIETLYNQDQSDRLKMETTGSATWQIDDMLKMAQRDRERRQQTMQLLKGGRLHSADDYFHAGMVMQHGDKPDDFLMAHVLAAASLRLGREKSAWLAAASLDRYLMKIGQAQIFGSQFNNVQPADPSLWTNQPYNSKLVSDDLRKIYYQPTFEETEKRLQLLKSNKPLGPSSPD